jgi:flagellar FliJ protein
MPKFKFRFDSVKKVKEAFEKKAQKELAQIDLHIEQHEIIKVKLINELSYLHKPSDQKRIAISELKFISQYKNSLVNRIEEKDKEIIKLKMKRQEKVNEVVQKSKEKKINFENFRILSYLRSMAITSFSIVRLVCIYMYMILHIHVSQSSAKRIVERNTLTRV